jgi:hypothetical protein
MIVPNTIVIRRFPDESSFNKRRFAASVLGKVALSHGVS